MVHITQRESAGPEEEGTAVPISEGAAGPAVPARERGRAVLGDLRVAVQTTATVLAAIWLVQAVNVLDGYGLDTGYGARSRDLSTLPYVVLAPLLHFGLDHIESNTPPLAILTFLTVLGGLKRYLYVTGFIVLAGGIGTWLIGPADTYSVGASGLIFGYLGYLVARGLFARSVRQALWQIPLGVLLFVYYKWTVVLLYPSAIVNAMHISWQGHLCGLLSGIVVAYLVRRRGRPLDDPRRMPDPAG